MFRPLTALARTPLLGGHPAVLQLPFDLLQELIAESLRDRAGLPHPDGQVADAVRAALADGADAGARGDGRARRKPET